MVVVRKGPLVTNQIYHVMSKSIAGYQIFNSKYDYDYFLKALRYFTLRIPPNKFSYFMKRSGAVQENGFESAVESLAKEQGTLVSVISFCIMPTHFHIVIKQDVDGGISDMMRRALNAYTRYFNIKHNRYGPLWTGRFKSVRIENDEQLLHITRYVFLNPVTANLVKKAEDWHYSSYKEVVDNNSVDCPWTRSSFNKLIRMSPSEYRSFCEDQADLQRELAIIKKQIIEK